MRTTSRWVVQQLHAPVPLILTSGGSVSAGFPSPAQDYYDGRVDLNEKLITDAASTFILVVAGDSMAGAAISDRDMIIVDRSLTATPGDVVVAVLDGEFVLKRLTVGRGRVVLKAENPDYPDIEVPTLSDLRIWGVVTWSLHRHHV